MREILFDERGRARGVAYEPGLCRVTGGCRDAFDQDGMGWDDYTCGGQAGALEHALFVGGVALDRLDEVGDEVEAALQLDVDLSPGVFRPVARFDEIVVGEEEPPHQGDDDDEKTDEEPFHGTHHTKPGRRVTGPPYSRVMEPSAYFTVGRDGTFVPTDYTRGPWSVESCHAGPPTGLMARASEAAVPDKPLVRLMVEITRPIPMSGFRIGSVIARTGRTVTTTRIELHDDERSYATAEGLHLAEGEIGPVTSHHVEVLDPDDAVPGPFPITNFLSRIFAASSSPMPFFNLDILCPVVHPTNADIMRKTSTFLMLHSAHPVRSQDNKGEIVVKTSIQHYCLDF